METSTYIPDSVEWLCAFADDMEKIENTIGSAPEGDDNMYDGLRRAAAEIIDLRNKLSELGYDGIIPSNPNFTINRELVRTDAIDFERPFYMEVERQIYETRQINDDYFVSVYKVDELGAMYEIYCNAVAPEKARFIPILRWPQFIYNGTSVSLVHDHFRRRVGCNQGI